MTVTTLGVPAMVIDSVWPDIEPMVARAFDKLQEYRWLPEDIRELIRNNSLQLWLCLEDKALRGILLTEIVVAPRAVECNLFLMAGELPEDWRNTLEHVEKWAKDIGCTHMATISRPGSAKIVGYSKGMIRTFRRL